MRKMFAKRLLATAIALTVSLAAFAVPAFAESSAQNKDDGYVVTFRPGEHGTYGLNDALKTKYGENVKLTDNGSLAFLLHAGDALPAVDSLPFTVTDETGRYYVYNKAPGYSSSTVLERDLDFVAEYAMSTEKMTYDYEVHFVDVNTKEEVAPTMIGQAGGPKAVLHAAAVDYYKLALPENCGYNEAGDMEVEFKQGETSVFTFYYQYDPTYIPGQTIYQTVHVGGGTGAGGTGTGGELIAGGDTDNTTQPETPVETMEPQAPITGGEEIEEPDVPRAETPDEEKATQSTVVMVGGLLGVLLLIVLVVLFFKRKKNNNNQAQ